jgi:hypothetical protein
VGAEGRGGGHGGIGCTGKTAEKQRPLSERQHDKARTKPSYALALKTVPAACTALRTVAVIAQIRGAPTDAISETGRGLRPGKIVFIECEIIMISTLLRR